MDGLESLFSPSMMGSANAVLRAFNNRKYIFFLTLMLDQAKLKAVEGKKKEEQGWSYNCCTILRKKSVPMESARSNWTGLKHVKFSGTIL